MGHMVKVYNEPKGTDKLGYRDALYSHTWAIVVSVALALCVVMQ